MDQSFTETVTETFTETVTESYIQTETKDLPKCELVFWLDSAIG